MKSYRAFAEVEYRIREMDNVTVINPRRISSWDLSWETYMQIAQAILYSGEIDLVVLLEGWEMSKGCCIEKVWAEACGIRVAVLKYPTKTEGK